MNIGVSARLLLQNRLEGIGIFARETLRRMVVARPHDRFFFFFDRPYSDEFIFAPNVEPVVIGPPARHPLLYLAWAEWSVARAARRCKLDVFLSPDGIIPLRSPVPTVTVLHDINFEHYPQFLPFAYRWYYRTMFPRFARRASCLATVSEFSSNDITKHYGISRDNIRIVHNSALDVFHPFTAQEQQCVREQYTNGQPYFLFVGLLHARKNVAMLLRAFELFKQRTTSPVKLVLAGAEKWDMGDIAAALESMQSRADVVFTGRIPEAELVRVYGAAHALTYIPLFEGFGIPLVEAMHAEIPILTSSVTSLPEVAGNAALLVDPHAPQAIADAMQALATDETVRQELIERGRVQRGRFSWDTSAQTLWQCVEYAVARGQ